jgi:YidC/Oxa1 family membrane protein insertase
MDRKSIIILVLCFAAFFSWHWLVNKIYPPKILPPGSTNVANVELSSTNGNVPPELAPGSTNPASSETRLTARAVTPKPGVPEELIEVASPDAHYTFSSYGGGLKQVELLKYPETVSRASRGRTNRVATLNTYTPMPTLAILGGDEVEGDGVFKLTRTANGVHAEKQLTNGLSLVKDFEISTNYLVLATVRLENRSDKPLALPAQEWFAGTATPMSARDDGSAVGVMWYNGSKAQDIIGASYFSAHGFACMPRVPPVDFRGGQTNAVWVAAHNQFFALAVMPELQQPATQVIMRPFPLPRPNEEELTYRSVRGRTDLSLRPGTDGLYG